MKGLLKVCFIHCQALMQLNASTKIKDNYLIKNDKKQVWIMSDNSYPLKKS